MLDSLSTPLIYILFENPQVFSRCYTIITLRLPLAQSNFEINWKSFMLTRELAIFHSVVWNFSTFILKEKNAWRIHGVNLTWSLSFFSFRVLLFTIIIKWFQLNKTLEFFHRISCNVLWGKMHEKLYDIKFDCVLIAAIFHARCNFSLLHARTMANTHTHTLVVLEKCSVRAYFYCFLATFFAKTHKSIATVIFVLNSKFLIFCGNKSSA